MQPGIFLTMTGRLRKVVFVLELEDNDLVPFSQTLRSSQHLGAINSRFTYGNIFIIRDEKNFVQLYLITLGLAHKIDIYRLTRSDFILFTTGFNYSVNGTPP